MYICICNAVTDRQIRTAVESGHCSLGMISRELGVATNCGKCRNEACRVIRDHLVEIRQQEPALQG